MKVVSVINYKGGVGKTTLTANIGAELAFRGGRVLLIDLDPQTSLTFSFFSIDDWFERLADSRTIKQWYDTAQDSHTPTRLADLLSTPRRVNDLIQSKGGRLDVLASHLELINIDLDLAAELGGGTWQRSQTNYLRIHRRLADGLADSAFTEYDLVLIDCAPNFNITTKTAIVASDHILVPAKPDYLSTLGIGYLARKLRDLVADYNACAATQTGSQRSIERIDLPDMAVVFTMIQRYSGEPILALRPYIEQIQELGVPTFKSMVRDNKSLFAAAAETGVPAVLSEGNQEIVDELDDLVDEFSRWLERTGNV